MISPFASRMDGGLEVAVYAVVHARYNPEVHQAVKRFDGVDSPIVKIALLLFKNMPIEVAK